MSENQFEKPENMDPMPGDAPARGKIEWVDPMNGSVHFFEDDMKLKEFLEERNDRDNNN